MLGIHFTPTVPQTYRDWLAQNQQQFIPCILLAID
jgi:hypothetical protein